MTTTYSEKEWQFRQYPGYISDEQIKQTALELGVPETIVRILAIRGVSDPKTINTFLTPVLAQLPRPHLMKGMDEAVAILLDAIKFQKPLTVFGDFDADGITATSLITLFLNELGTPVKYYIPDRFSEGYGLNSDAVKKIYADNMGQWAGGGVLLTADCGISDAEVVTEAKRLGFTVIITDHHRPPAELPQADTILNPLQPDCSFPCKNLAGVGVAFYLILGLRSELMKNGYWPENKIPNLKLYMDLAAIGTVADQVPVTGCNRIIVKAGLEVLNTANRIGLQELLDKTKNNGTGISPEDIAFRLAPRINAVGRIGSAMTAVKLMTTNSREEAQQFARELEEANNARKKIEAAIFSEAVNMVTAATLDSANSLILHRHDWHQGVLGIVASRMSDRFQRPVILLTDCAQGDGAEPLNLVKGSGRSIDGIDIHEAVSSCKELLLRFGGHAGAVGLTLPAVNIASFRHQFDGFIKTQTHKHPLSPDLFIDLQLTLNDLNDKEFLAAYGSLAPFGTGNPEPVFSLTAQKLSNPRLVGSNHLKFSIMQDNNVINGIGFGFGSLIELSQKNPVDLAFTLRLNSYMGQAKWEMNLIDLKPCTS
jgi:single-stranded-DNA-specific exonuclease